MSHEFVPGFDSILDQQRPVRILRSYLRRRTIPHALLFTGIEGVGKRTTALAFAMACNCMHHKGFGRRNGNKDVDGALDEESAADPCYQCRACKKITSGNHPDIIHIEPSGLLIRIDQIRRLCHVLSMKPYEARQRVVILSNAQSMTPEAGNALLKALEEPPDRTVMVLTAVQRSDLLPTISSRCQHIRFSPVSMESLISLLVEKRGLDLTSAKIVAVLSTGSISKAMSMARSNWIDRRNWLLGELAALPSRSSGTLMALAEKLSKNKELLEDSLEVMKTWFRDLAIYPYHPDKIINRDLTGAVREASRHMTPHSILSKIDAVHSAQRAIRSNGNLRLTLEVMTFRLSGG
jgi:DNA polymerase III subunit delta'